MSHVWTTFKIETDDEHIGMLHVEMSAANKIEFDLTYSDYHQAVADICNVAPHMMRLDSDLAEAYDDAFRTKPKLENKRAVAEFLAKYKGKISPDTLYEMFV